MSDQSPVYKVQGEGQTFTYYPTAEVKAGAVVVINGAAYISLGDYTADNLATKQAHSLSRLRERPHWKFPKETGAIADGAEVFWHVAGNPLNGDAGTGAINTTSGGGVSVGFAFGAALAGDEYAEVAGDYATNNTSTSTGTVAATVTDPGASGAIPVTASGHVDIVTAGAETRTLAAPTAIDQTLLISFKTKVGNCTITCATTVNTTGNNTILLSAAGQAILLAAKTSGSNLRWYVVSNDGAALSTV